MRIDNQQQQNKGVMDLMPQTGAVEEKKRNSDVCGCGKDRE